MIRRALDNPWLQHPRIWLTVGVLGMILTVATWTLNRDPPTTIGTQIGDPPRVEAGKEVILRMTANRNLSRQCSVTINRDLITSNHERVTLVNDHRLTAEGRQLRAEDKLDELAVNVRIPANTPAGPAKIISDVTYKCMSNPSTWFLPIEDSWLANVEVLPPSAVIVVPVSK